VKGTSGRVECPRVDHSDTTCILVSQTADRVEWTERTSSSSDHGQLREPHVVADADSNLAKIRLDDRDFVPARQSLALLESDPAGDVDVEEMHFSVQGDELSRGREGGRRVIDLAIEGTLRDRSWRGTKSVIG
jgi:hypothetical protein